MDYVTLGLLVEVNCEQRLGLNSTYAGLRAITSKKVIVKDLKPSFFVTTDYEISAEQGNVRQNYILQFRRYLQIDQNSAWRNYTARAVYEKNKKSHSPNAISKIDANTNYAAGRYVNTKTNEIYHPGGAVNYSTNITMRMHGDIAVGVLTNRNASSNTNNVATNIS